MKVFCSVLLIATIARASPLIRSNEVPEEKETTNLLVKVLTDGSVTTTGHDDDALFLLDSQDGDVLRGGREPDLEKAVYKKWHCTLSASDTTTCHSKHDEDGERHCKWCALSHDAKYGICLSPDLTGIMEMIFPKVSCAGPFQQEEDPDAETIDFSTDIKLVHSLAERDLEPIDDFRCSIDAMSDVHKCAVTTIFKEDHTFVPCHYCTRSDDNDGLCVNVKQAQTLATTSQFICDTPPPNDFMCTMTALSSEQKCSHAQSAQHQPCSFCKLSMSDDSPGICVSSNQAEQIETLTDHVSCVNGQQQEAVEQRIMADSSIDESLPGVSPYRCSMTAFSDADKCAATMTSDDDDAVPCQYCEMNGPTGLCVSPKQAETMKRYFPDQITCGTAVEGAFDQFRCTTTAFTNEDKCLITTTTSGEKCSYCSMAIEGQSAGVCVSPEQAEQMKYSSKQVSCTNSITSSEEEEEVKYDDNSFSDDNASVSESDVAPYRCTVIALTDAGKCANTETIDSYTGHTVPCEFCKTRVNGRQVGICLSPDHASTIESYSDEIVCDNSSDEMPFIGDLLSSLRTNPVMACNLDGVDLATCLDEKKVNAECAWCDAGVGGFCFPVAWEKKAGKFFHCTTDPNSPTPTTSAAIAGKSVGRWDFLNSSCLKGGTDEDSCSLTLDTTTDRACVWCDGAGVFGLCLSPEQASKAGTWLACGNNDRGDTNVVDPNDREIRSSADNGIGPFMLRDDEEEASISRFSFLDSSCLKKGLTGDSIDDCTDAVDDKTGEHCVFCRSPNFGGIGLCMPSRFDGKQGRWYSCINSDE